MEIKILGCFGSEMPGHRTTCFKIDNSTLVDAGAVTSVLDRDGQIGINNILLTHAHLDHVKDIPLLADNVIGCISRPVNIISTSEIIASLREHLFNDRIWPDFTKIPSISNPVLSYREIEPETSFKINHLTVTAVQVNHTVPAVGYIISDGGSAVAISGDTCSTDRFWEITNRTDEIKAVFVETSFPDEMKELAIMSGHLTPSMMHDEINKLNNVKIPVFLYHLKPNFLNLLSREISSIKNADLSILEQDRSYTF